MLTPVAAVLFARTTAAIALLVTLQFAVFVLLFITKLKSVHYRRHQHCCCYCVRPLHPLLLYYSKNDGGSNGNDYGGDGVSEDRLAD